MDRVGEYVDPAARGASAGFQVAAHGHRTRQSAVQDDHPALAASRRGVHDAGNVDDAGGGVGGGTRRDKDAPPGRCDIAQIRHPIAPVDRKCLKGFGNLERYELVAVEAQCEGGPTRQDHRSQFRADCAFVSNDWTCKHGIATDGRFHPASVHD